jgi:hypothetical protein
MLMGAGKLAGFSGRLITMRQASEFFGDEELALIYVAKRLKEAVGLEELLTQSGFDYLVEPDKYSGGVIFRSERVGAFFYVAPANQDAVQQAMLGAGFKPYALE